MYKNYYFNFKIFKNKYLLTNDFGNYIFLNKNDFDLLVNRRCINKKLMKELQNKQFIYTDEDEDFIKFNYEKLKDYKKYLNDGTILHIFVVSKNCNYNCTYCQAGNLGQKERFLMNEDVAKKAVNIVFEAHSKNISIEFQGGEPLLNFEIIKCIVNYSNLKNSTLPDDKRKNIEFNLVSNLSLLTDEMIKYMIDNNITVCTSIDGNSILHNTNRPFANGDSYAATVNGMKKLLEHEVQVSALLTTTRSSLSDYKNIVDEYIKLGLNRIWLRPLTKLGKACSNWDEIGYSADEFIEYYRKTLAYIIKKNKQGIYIDEGIATILLSKIIKGESINYMELRSPCGAAIGQLAYYYDGEIYTCDEARMLAEMGDKKFLLGNVSQDSYSDLMNNKLVKEVCSASCTETSSCCHSCVYMPYCGICPVLNYAEHGDMNCFCKNDFKCKIMMGILDTLFSYIEKDKSVLKIFERWVEINK